MFVVTSRVEYLTANALSVSHVHRATTTPWYLQPPTPTQVQALVRTRCSGKSAATTDEILRRVLASELSATPLLAIMMVDALTLDMAAPLDLWNVYRGAIRSHYELHGIPKVWSKAVEAAVERLAPGSTKVGKIKILADLAYEFGSLLALRTYRDGSWPVGIDVHTYKSRGAAWGPELDPSKRTLMALAVDDAALSIALFDMQPTRAESMESGSWAFRHKTVHEHLIANALLVHAARLGLRHGPHVADSAIRGIPRAQPGIMKHCVACAHVHGEEMSPVCPLCPSVP